MTAALLPQPHSGQVGMAMSAMTAPLRQTCAVRLIDRRTGQTDRNKGRPPVGFTRTPDLAVSDLPEGDRDASVWEARVEPLGGRA